MVDASARIFRHMRRVYTPAPPLTSCKTKTHIGLRVYYTEREVCHARLSKYWLFKHIRGQLGSKGRMHVNFLLRELNHTLITDRDSRASKMHIDGLKTIFDRNMSDQLMGSPFVTFVAT